MSNQRRRTTSWGRTYYERVTCPARGTVMHVIPPDSEGGLWTYVVRDLGGALLGVYEWPSIPDIGLAAWNRGFWAAHDRVRRSAA